MPHRVRALLDAQGHSDWSVLDVFSLDGRTFARVGNPPTAATEPGDASLSPREREVLSHLAVGHANKRIAYDLGISESTVSSLLRRAAKKTAATSRADLVRLSLALAS